MLDTVNNPPSSKDAAVLFSNCCCFKKCRAKAMKPGGLLCLKHDKMIEDNQCQ